MKKKRQRRVALLIETSNAYGRGLLRGVRAYNHEHGEWSTYLGEQRRGEPAPQWLSRWKGDGVIARLENPAIAAAVQALRCPVVDVSAARVLPELPYVETDDRAIALAAAEHLLARGFARFAYCGQPTFFWSNNRERYFCERITQAGFEISVFPDFQQALDNLSWDEEQTAIEKWLRRLPKPVGVMACYDMRGRQVLDACRHLHLDVPDQVAVIGVDNDELICEMSDPPLSSVVPDAAGAGYEAARLLNRLMRGRRVEARGHLLPPVGVVTRRSTESFGVDDPDVSLAARLIREQACRGVKVADLVARTNISRRILESRFKKLLGRTPHEEIIRIQIERVKELLSHTDLALSTIADRAGFKHLEYMSVAFKRETGRSPGDYREALRLGDLKTSHPASRLRRKRGRPSQR